MRLWTAIPEIAKRSGVRSWMSINSPLPMDEENREGKATGSRSYDDETVITMEVNCPEWNRLKILWMRFMRSRQAFYQLH